MDIILSMYMTHIHTLVIILYVWAFFLTISVIGLCVYLLRRNRGEQPDLKTLQSFVNRYFKKNPPKVKWKKMEELGMADLKKRIIYINPDQSQWDLGCQAGSFNYKPKRKINLSDFEKYFHTLIHEIGHFKVKPKIPKEFLRERKILIEKYPNDLEMQVNEATLKRHKGESDERFQGRIAELEDWLCGDMPSHHIDIEEWATEEFMKQKKEINKMKK